jgi:pimeloyl-ACP methyl ester carboxylesterase
MSVFCLVHGSTQGPNGWELLVSELRALGHHCICVDLPTDQPDSSATAYASAIGKVLEKSTSPIVVAHSASGLFLPLIPKYAAVAKLVYLAAVLPVPGESFISQFQRDQEMYRPGFVGKDPTKDEALACQYLFHDCPPNVRPWALSTLRLMFAKQAIVERSPLKRWPEVPSKYISCSEDRVLNPDWWEMAARERLRADPIRIEAGHAPHVSRPVALATILDSLTTS